MKLLLRILLPLFILLISTNALSLTMTQFKEICLSSENACNEHQLLQAYVGGALDFIAAQDEETDYLQTKLCVDPSSIFDVNRIIDYMIQDHVGYLDKNAMLLLIQYLQENGGC